MEPAAAGGPSPTPPRAPPALCRATKKQGGSTGNRGNQLPKFLGVKLSGGAPAGPGAIIIRQRGTRVHPGIGVGMVRGVCGERKGCFGVRLRVCADGPPANPQGRDHTLFALTPGVVTFGNDKAKGRKIVSVLPRKPRAPAARAVATVGAP